MSVYTIDILNAAEWGSFYFTSDLDGENYEFRFKYNSREERWYLDLLDNEGNVVRAGMKVVVNWPVLLRMMELNRPPGEILFINTQDRAEDPGLDELGVDAVLTYVEEGSLPSE